MGLGLRHDLLCDAVHASMGIWRSQQVQREVKHPEKNHLESADPACSRGSASEEELPAARAKKSLQSHGLTLLSVDLARRKQAKRHYKQQGQEARKQERRSKKQEAITGNKRRRSKKQEARKQHAAGRQVRELVLLSIQTAPLGRRLEDSSES